MATVRAFLRNRKNQDGTQPLVIRICKDRKVSIIHLGYHLKENEWDKKLREVKKSHPNSKRLNNLIAKRIAEVSGDVISLETEKEKVSVGAIKKRVKKTSVGPVTFFAIANKYLETLRGENKYNQYTADKPRIKHFRDFVKGPDPSLSEVDVALLTRFRAYLKSEYKTPYKSKPRLSERSIENHFVAIRSVFSFARKVMKVIDKDASPFGENGILIDFPESVKIGLNQDEVIRLENVELDLPADNIELDVLDGDVKLRKLKDNDARNVWLYAFYFGGMRSADVLLAKWTDFQDDRLHYVMGKNDKAGSLKISEKVIGILNQYRKEKDETGLIFPYLKRLKNLEDPFIVERAVAFATSAIDKRLRKNVAPAAGITKKLTMHIARHTFGNLSGSKVPPQLLQKIYRHSDIKTTIGYQQNFIHEEIDNALDAVINF